MTSSAQLPRVHVAQLIMIWRFSFCTPQGRRGEPYHSHPTQSSLVTSRPPAELIGLFAGWFLGWFGLAGAGLLWEKNTVGWLKPTSEHAAYFHSQSQVNHHLLCYSTYIVRIVTGSNHHKRNCSRCEGGLIQTTGHVRGFSLIFSCLMIRVYCLCPHLPFSLIVS